ncbi:ankyrin repeat domain-containing protein [Microbacterium sp. Mu-80]|uniref:Ankyrin repeat domain-containing protein n=1 Tax=Microbacterium bandirmense TaxID=3122050 RepID=A0ABU8L8E5_9MICO
MSSEWPGVTDTGAFKESHVADVDRLADAAKTGSWAEVLILLEAHDQLSPNQWRISGTSWFTPLHQAAWLGASSEVVDELVRRGAWRSLRNAEGERPIEIAERRGHHHLLEPLNVRPASDRQQQMFATWDRHLAELIATRTERLDPVSFRAVPTEVIAVEPLDTLWFRYPGMYGGFGMSIHRDRLFVESWSRVVGGSGQAHVITEGGCVLVEEGFV